MSKADQLRRLQEENNRLKDALEKARRQIQDLKNRPATIGDSINFDRSAKP